MLEGFTARVGKHTESNLSNVGDVQAIDSVGLAIEPQVARDLCLRYGNAGLSPEQRAGIEQRAKQIVQALSNQIDQVPGQLLCQAGMAILAEEGGTLYSKNSLPIIDGLVAALYRNGPPDFTLLSGFYASLETAESGNEVTEKNAMQMLTDIHKRLPFYEQPLLLEHMLGAIPQLFFKEARVQNKTATELTKAAQAAVEAAQMAAVVEYGYKGKTLAEVQAGMEESYGIKSAWDEMTLPPEVLAAIEAIGLTQLPDGRIVCTTTGLVACMARSPGTNKILLALPGTTSGEVKGGALSRILGNPGMHYTQWTATNWPSANGEIPYSYVKAVCVTEILIRHFGKTNLILAGHSKGAGEVGYAAMKADVPAYCFCPPPFGTKILAEFTPDELIKAKGNIRILHIEGDPVTSTLSDRKANMLSLLTNAVASRFPLAYVGNGLAIPADPNVFGTLYSGGIFVHENFADHAAASAQNQIAEAKAASAAEAALASAQNQVPMPRQPLLWRELD